VKRAFTVRWLIKIFNIPRDGKIKLLYAIKRMHAEEKIKRRSNKAWEWNGNP